MHTILPNIIPGLDLSGGKVIPLTDAGRSTIYSQDPIDQAKKLQSLGFKFLHISDVDGAKEGKPIHLDLLEKVASACNLSIDFGGGIRSEEDIKAVFDAGAEQVVIGTHAAKNREEFEQWLQRYGDRLILSADASDDQLVIDGWEKEGSSLEDFLEYWSSKGCPMAIVTDIERDGKMLGPNGNLYKRLLDKKLNMEIIASGGISSVEDLKALHQTGITKAIVGKALLSGKLDALFEAKLPDRRRRAF